MKFVAFPDLNTHIIITMPEKNKTDDYPVGPDGKKLKPCCVCLDTKRVRDECIMEKVGNPSLGDQEESCKLYISFHNHREDPY